MNRIHFGYDIKKDAWSWVLIAKSKNIWGRDPKRQVVHIPDDLLKKILKNNHRKAEVFVVDYLKNHPNRKYREKVIREEIKALENIWRTKEAEYFKILEQITQKPIYRKNFGAYYTSGFMCPYNLIQAWFMVSMWHNIPFSIGTICHEVMHLQFHYYYEKWCLKNGLSKDQFHNLKESLTFLLNEPEFENIILQNEQGYPDHLKLRSQLQKLWQKEKNFEKFLTNCFKILNDFFR
jgi:hypothetical protein